MPWGNIPRLRSRCGAYVVLNRGCNSQCIFAPYFRCEDDIARFVAICDVFTVKNVVNFLASLPQQVSELQAYRAYLQDSLFAYYSSYPQPNRNPSWNFDLAIIPKDVPYPSFSEATLPPYPGEASSSQMPPPDDIDELGPVVFGNRRLL
ncbi:LOB domain-containing protein 30-like [Diospyros lotus]|uniref:LOB domain-containing protein 30-like n=1 Tax=Diospyros lotus TaxID=55363 RepID=UPI00225851A7|nr:LOB domain-containing protein 30-like [Diospyros lotus]